MKAKQKKIRVFDIVIDSEEKFFDYMEKNLILLKDYLLLVDGVVTDRIEKFLEENSLCYVVQQNCNLKTIQSQPSQTQPTQTPQPTKVEIVKEIVYQESENQPQTTKVINKPIRSGAVIESDSDVVIFSRVNSGAKVISEGNISVYGEIDGVVEANGDFAVIKSIGKGYVIFNGDILEKEDFDGGLKKVFKVEDGYKIEDL